MEINDKIKESKLKISESKSKVMDFDTFINVNGFPIIRRCKNCKFWQEQGNSKDKDKLGSCTLNPLFFSFNMKPTVFFLTKEFCLCENHEFGNEDVLKESCESVKMKDILKNKDDI